MDYDKIMAYAKKVGFCDLELNISKHKGIEISLFQGKIEKNQQSDITKCSLRGIYNERLVVMGLENICEENILKSIDELKELAKCLTTSDPVMLYEGSKEYSVIPPHIENINEYMLEDKIDLLERLEKTIISFEGISKEVECGYEESFNEVNIINTKGLNISHKNMISYLYAQALAKNEDDAFSSFDYQAALDFNKFDPEKLGKDIATKALNSLGGRPVKSKKYDIVFSNETFAKILGAFSSMFSGEMAMKKLSPLKDKIGEKIFGDNVTIIDTGIKEEALAYYQFDDEGVSTKEKEVVKNGLFMTFLHNLQTAKVFNVSSTGNGTKNGVSPQVFYLEKGTISFNDLLKEDGLYITDVQGLHAGINAKSGDFSLQSKGFKIVGGKITSPISMIVVSGNIIELLNNIEKIGDDLKFHFHYGSPSIRIKNLNVSGN